MNNLSDAIVDISSAVDPVVSVRSVGKAYQIYSKPADRLLRPLANQLRRLLGFEARLARHFNALQDVSFDISPGETVGIIGRNGCGKSTLLQIIVGTLTPTTGAVAVRGRVSALLELGAGFNPEFTGRENVYLAGAIIGLGSSEMTALLPVIEKFADIGEYIDQPVKTYSSGMYVRLAFSVAIHVSPDILVVDEALAVGDTAFQTKCLTRIRKMQSEGVSIILVTHSTNTLLEYCDRGIYLRHGKVVLDGNCRDVVKRYADDLVDEEGGAVVYNEQDDQSITEGSTPDATDERKAERLDGGGVEPASEILSVQIADQLGKARTTFSFGERLTVKVKLRVHRPIETPCYGIQIKSVDDIALWAGTTQNMQIDVPRMLAGIHEFRWDLLINFSGNRYVIAVGVGDIDSGEYHRHSRVPYAGHIDVLPHPRSGHGWLAPQPRFTLS
ncbi:ABC transporter ATP-binding protein [Dyella ginsengisoli]|uniref:ABC transporter ATP-binding protein n=1 Tax=Dyella ginsengisoli TaxID=363848 RepID=UPI000A0543E2|nr:ABC transporter ATP-binding protein [Dyella ginsengisoli]